MKMSHRLQSQSAGPVRGLVFGILMSAVGLGLWFCAGVSPRDQSVAVAALLIGVFVTVYAAREIRHRKRR
jgi:hypothetical protein